MIPTFLSILLIYGSFSQSCSQLNHPLHQSITQNITLNSSNHIIHSFVSEINRFKFPANLCTNTISISTSEEHLLQLQEILARIKYTLFQKEQEHSNALKESKERNSLVKSLLTSNHNLET